MKKWKNGKHMRINVKFLEAVSGLYNLGLNSSTCKKFTDYHKSPYYDFNRTLQLVRLTGKTWFSLDNSRSNYYTPNAINIVFEKTRGKPSIKKLRKKFLYETNFHGLSVAFEYIKKRDLPKLDLISDFIYYCIKPDSLYHLLQTTRSRDSKLNPLVFKRPQTFIKYFVDALSRYTFAFAEAAQNDYIEKLKNFLILAFGEQGVKETEDTETKYYEYPFIRVVSRVYEIPSKNLRFFITKQKVPARWGNEKVTYIKMGVCHANNPIYDYIDVGRLTINPWQGNGRSSANFVEPPVDFFIGDKIIEEIHPTLPSIEVLNDYAASLTGHAEQEFINNDFLAQLAKDYINKINRNEQKAKQKYVLEEKLRTKLETFDETSKLKINDVMFTKHFIEYQGQRLTIQEPQNENWSRDILSSAMRALDRLNFETIFDAFLNIIVNDVIHTRYSSIRQAALNKTIKGNIGDIAFQLEKRVLTNVNRVSSDRFYINDSRINKEELLQVLSRGLCFNNQKDFDYFVKEVSKCSLKTHRYLYNGVECHPYDQFLEAHLHIKFILERKIYNYLKVEDRLYKIRDTAKLTALTEARDLMDVINVLLNPAVIEGISIKDITSIVNTAAKDFTTAVEKSEQLLRETEKLFKISVKKYTLADGSVKEGYLIKGKIREYLLEAKEAKDGRNSVYEFPSGRYICIVDKSNNQVGKDKLVNRIFALHNDSLLAQEISTLR